MGSEVSETSRFAMMFDKFFDLLNVSNFDSGKKERKPFKDPHRSATDFRLKVKHRLASMFSVHNNVIVVARG